MRLKARSVPVENIVEKIVFKPVPIDIKSILRYIPDSNTKWHFSTNDIL